ncbi:hypothetical protein TRIUR3_28330 [Triticum urartu]|uniref:Uncharacterized protein n=1 Tax=Triticum urartu TaxID=4572 RepID=M7ZRW8_TRIUA|nr:hypothetical protein TRIUR3_28330 [Triticum urartu]
MGHEVAGCPGAARAIKELLGPPVLLPASISPTPTFVHTPSTKPPATEKAPIPATTNHSREFERARLYSPDNAPSRGPLHASVDAKLQTLCQNITASKNAKKSASVSASTAAATSSTPTSNCSSPSSDEASSSLESAESSPSPATTTAAEVPEMQQLDFSEAPWDEAACFALTKYPSYEIDWDSLLAAN